MENAVRMRASLINREFPPFAHVGTPKQQGGPRGGRPCVSGRERARARTRRARRNACARGRARASRGCDARVRETRAPTWLAKRPARHAVVLEKRVKIGPRARRRGSKAARARETWRDTRADHVPCGRLGWTASHSTRVSAPRARETCGLFHAFTYEDETALKKKKMFSFMTCNQSEKRGARGAPRKVRFLPGNAYVGFFRVAHVTAAGVRTPNFSSGSPF